MELKHDNPNGEIVIERKLNSLTQKNLKKIENCNQNLVLKFFFLRFLDCPKNKIVHKFLIIIPN